MRLEKTIGGTISSKTGIEVENLVLVCTPDTSSRHSGWESLSQTLLY